MLEILKGVVEKDRVFVNLLILVRSIVVCLTKMLKTVKVSDCTSTV